MRCDVLRGIKVSALCKKVPTWPTYTFSRSCGRAGVRTQDCTTRRRHFSLDAISPIILAPTVFGGLVVTLWTYKCLMMVIFQNKIIYMPSIPPFSRSEKLSDYAIQCRPVIWREVDIKACDGTKLKLLEGRIPFETGITKSRTTVVVYFQGCVIQFRVVQGLKVIAMLHRFLRVCHTYPAY